MIRKVTTSRRGAALLIVLAVLILAVTAAATLTRLASTARAHRIFANNTIIANDLLRASEEAIFDWLRSHSSEVVLPPVALWPRTDVLDDTWAIEGRDYGIRVTAWDQCGMVPIEVARSGSPLRSSLPEEIRRSLDQIEIPQGLPAGLDLFSKPDQPRDVRIFPCAASDDPGAPHHVTGACVGTHASRRLNVSTAPIDLVAAALRVAGRGGLEQIAAARAEGRPVTVSALPSIGGRGDKTLRLTAASTAWGFRIDIRVGPLRRSWWSVYVKQDSKPWECVQRLAIPE